MSNPFIVSNETNRLEKYKRGEYTHTSINKDRGCWAPNQAEGRPVEMLIGRVELMLYVLLSSAQLVSLTENLNVLLQAMLIHVI